ncbi:hypothetical protein [Ferrimicrobium acidiphilum]|uniref:Uncharacterized protein n=1 Tax=Ferrimicrobium acidiphilum DSM 19497 TaxID=1121877 RepID=A0A0D8FWL8_9ACTN|nr:hypothetical protein [Ferrimicrobium acidiphilum]KJE77314.1 hypothetical protein FEAC_10290 [Ferrimicrobium acidiphilum DSM 19497]
MSVERVDGDIGAAGHNRGCKLSAVCFAYLVQISEVFGHPFRSNPDTRFGVFGHLDRVGH